MSKTAKTEPQGITDPVVDTVDAWAEAGLHTITCNTGTRVTIRIPDLADMIEGGELPQNLLDAALQAAGNQVDDGENKKVTVEDVKRDHEFTHFLVSRTLVKPEVTPETAGRIPQEDKELIAAIALRLREFDAEGTHIFGLDRSAKYRKFRGIGEFEPTVEGDKAAGRAWPTLSDDDVVDFMIMEAINIKVTLEDVNAQKAAEKDAERRKFRNTRDKTSPVAQDLEKYR